MDVRHPSAAHVFHQAAQRLVAERLAVHFGAQVGHGFEKRRVAHLDQIALLRCQQVPRDIGQRHFVRAQPVAADVVQDRQEMALAADQLDLGLRLEPFRAADRAVAAQVHHRLLVGVDAGAPCPQAIVAHQAQYRQMCIVPA